MAGKGIRRRARDQRGDYRTRPPVTFSGGFPLDSVVGPRLNGRREALEHDGISREGTHIHSPGAVRAPGGALRGQLSHATGESLAAIREYAARGRYRRAVDVGTGTGFTAFAVAPVSGQVVATDVTPEMLAEARRLGTAQGVTNVRYALGAAEHLPFADGALDLLTCRTAAHHFQDVQRAIDEWRRVLETGGTLLLSDSVAPRTRGCPGG